LSNVSMFMVIITMNEIVVIKFFVTLQFPYCLIFFYIVTAIVRLAGSGLFTL
jgi:uncharacterized membrane protein YcfT